MKVLQVVEVRNYVTGVNWCIFSFSVCCHSLCTRRQVPGGEVSDGMRRGAFIRHCDGAHVETLRVMKA